MESWGAENIRDNSRFLFTYFFLCYVVPKDMEPGAIRREGTKGDNELSFDAMEQGNIQVAVPRSELDVQVCSLKERLKLETGIRDSSAGMAGEAVGQHPGLTSRARELTCLLSDFRRKRLVPEAHLIFNENHFFF